MLDLTDAAVQFVVYPDAKLAQARFEADDIAGDKASIPLDDFQDRAVLQNGRFATDDGDVQGRSEVSVLSGNVIVYVNTYSSDTTQSGDVAEAVALARWGLGHLAEVRASTTDS